MVVQPMQPQAQAQVAAVQAQQAQALQAAVNAGAQGNQQRNPFWNLQGVPGGPPPMMAAGLPGNFYPQMAAFAASQENATAMVAVAKLGDSKNNPSSNSSLVVRSSARKFNINGGPFSVAQWTRKTVEENLEWLVKLSKRHSSNASAVLLAYGDGCETLVLLDDNVNKMPEDFRKVTKIGVGVSMAKADSSMDESNLANLGVLQPSDSIWEHLRFEQVDSSEKKVEKCIFIHTSVTVWGDSIEGRRRVLQVTTGSSLSFKPNALFEQDVLSKWKDQGSGGQVAVATAAAAEAEAPAENETWITFNPKELLLLEKAFDNRLTSRDMKTNVTKFTEEDKKSAQFVIKRANDEFVIRGPPRKRRKKAEIEKERQEEEERKKLKEKQEEKEEEEEEDEDEESEEEEKQSKKTRESSKKSKKPESTRKVKSEEKSEPKDDEDDEPISKMVKKAEKTPPKKRSRRSSSSSKESKHKSHQKSDEGKRRGRPKGSRNRPKEEPTPKKRSKSKSKK